MIELTLGAQQRLDSYFAELRRVLTDDGKADPVDVERDIRDHIQTALADAGGPVDESRLDQVLRSLGAPSEWIEHPDRPWFARPPKEWLNSAKQTVAEKVHRFAAGPESYRLPYLSLLTLVLGLMLAFLSGDGEAGVAIFAVAVIGAFVLARAAMAIQPEESLSPGQKWLLSPGLLMVYFPLMIALVAWPIVPGIFIVRQSLLPSTVKLNADMVEVLKLNQEKAQLEYLRSRRVTITDGERIRMPSDFDADIAMHNREIQMLQSQGIRPATPALVIAGGVTFVWWVILAIAGVWMRSTVQSVFAPYSLLFVRRSMFGIAVVSVLISALVLGVVAAGGP